MYSVAMRRKESQDDFFWKHDNYLFIECPINSKGRYWFADPFLFEKNGVTYIFYEAFDLVTQQGKIGYSIYQENGICTDPKIVIDENFHMSFPYIFEYNGDIYIMPETCGDWRVKLYKAVEFPDVWTPADVLLPDVYACDSIILEEDGKQWLLANEMYHHPPVNSFGSCWVKNVLYELSGLSVTGEGVKVGEGDFGIRNAGKSFYSDGKYYRIGQDCRNKKYGRGMALFEIESILPYKEIMVRSMDCIEMASHIKNTSNEEIIGVHTYNATNKYEIVDFSQIRPVGFGVRVKRAGNHFRKFIQPFIR